MKTFYSLLLILLYCFPSYSQPIFNQECFSEENNGMRSVAQGIAQDKFGFMWFATWSGLEKYDGYSFKNYKSQVGDGSTLTNNRLTSVQEGWNNNLWCCSYDNRAFLFDVHNEQFIDILMPIEQTMKRKNRVKDIYPLPKGITWIVCNGGYSYRVNERAINNKNSIKYYGTFDNSLRGNDIFSIFQDHEGDEWILTDEGPTIVGRKKIDCNYPFRFHIENKKFIWLITSNGYLVRYDKHNNTNYSIDIPYPIHQVESFNNLFDGTIAIGTDVGLILYSPQYDTYNDITSNFGNVTNYVGEDHKGDIWFSDNFKGICKYNRQSRKISRYFTFDEYLPFTERSDSTFFHEYKDGTIVIKPKHGVLGYYDAAKDKLIPIQIKGSYIDMTGTFIDKQENLWCSSQHSLSKLSVLHRNYKFADTGAEVRSIFIDRQKRLWIASKDGYIRIENNNTRELIGYLNQQGIITSRKESFGSNVYCMLQETNGTIWVGTRSNGLFVLKPETANDLSYKISSYHHQPQVPYSLNNNNIFSIFKDSKGRIWIGTYGGGLNLVKKSKGTNQIQFININNQLLSLQKYSYLKIRYLYEAKNVIFVCTTDGLITFSPDFKRFDNIKFNYNARSPYRTNGLSNNNIMKVFMDSYHNIYVVEYSGGFSRILSKNLLSDHLVFKTYDERNGLLSDLTMSILEDSHKFLWIFMEKGISKFNPITGVFNNFDKSFFMKDFSISEAQPLTDGQGNICIGTDSGTLNIPPTILHKRNFVPQIVFTEIKSQNIIFKNNRYDSDILKINPDERCFSVQFAALDYINTNDIKYAYRLKGGDEEWHYIGTSRIANFINIPNGKYELQVKSTNGDGVWYNNIRTLRIIVVPTFGESPLAWVLYLLISIAIMFTIIYILFYIYRLRHQVDIEQQLSDVKLRFFTNISHELRTPLTLISNPIEEVLENEHISDQAKGYLSIAKSNTDRMLRLINQLLDFRKIQNDKMKVLIEEVEIVSFLYKIADNFKSIAEERHLHYIFSPEIERQIIWADKDKLEKIFYNLISNAFKYTPESKSIIIIISKKEQTLSVQIKDEGIGINPTMFAKIFQRFETFAPTNTIPSSGIGLSIVKDYVELHHAKIDVNSIVGKGSKFIVTFLLGKEHFIKDPNAEFILNDNVDNNISKNDDQIDFPQNQDETLTILIVEDNKELRYFLKSVLIKDYNIQEAINGLEGMKAASENMPDIIITDIMMPVMDGMEMIKNIKSDKNICHIPIIVITAKASLDDRIAGIKNGADDYLIKPFSSSYLKARIISILEQRKQMQKHYIQLLLEKEALSTKDDANTLPSLTHNYDEEFINKVSKFIEQNIDNANLTVDELSKYLNTSRTVLYCKLKAIIGLSPIELIMRKRINHAALLIEEGKYTCSQVAYMSGFSDPKYFSKCFKRFKNIAPSKYNGKNII